MFHAIPIALRELRLAHQQRWLLYARLGSAALAAGAMVSASGLSTNLASGRGLFFPLLLAAWGVGLAGAGAWAAPCLHEEKETKMLDLLLLSHAGGLGIVAAKLLGRGLPIAQILLSAIPVFATVLVLGGVSSSEFWRAMAVMGVTVFANLSIGILMAAWFRSVWAAVLASVTCIAGLYLGGGALDVGLIRAWELDATVANILPHPAAALEMVSDMADRERFSTFTATCLTLLTLGFGALLLACLGLRRATSTVASRTTDRQ